MKREKTIDSAMMSEKRRVLWERNDIHGFEEEYQSDLSEDDCCSRIISDSYSKIFSFHCRLTKHLSTRKKDMYDALIDNDSRGADDGERVFLSRNLLLLTCQVH